MKTMNIGEFKHYLTHLFKLDESGETITVVNGKTKQVIGHYTPQIIRKTERRSGILEGKVTVTFAPDFKMTTEEFLGL